MFPEKKKNKIHLTANLKKNMNIRLMIKKSFEMIKIGKLKQ